ncbi:receptor-type adenylate cyclase, putative [Trypanosoma cruzi]|uniref:adenylate cyclase n=1 Tax=Trypanosoma cruzi (strain CL Brener) TaxID=353153 RepID=Q4DX61_TRYCC|nr:receptor-type adenylate cyclase, putative [Trypanosoma cruzi]EAN97111.1 receptor-type adenylate cyclase, putative [Trypanosoma cruzi]|eukprot:XP_818962.1 receptor-type adenylate cyclase [Trypanosoma cruzi strain CL Brener]
MVTGWAVMMAAARQGPGLHKETGCCGGIPLLGWRLSTYALYLVLLLLLLPQSGVGQAACPEIEVKVLTLNVTDLPIPTYLSESLYHGFVAALWSRNYIVGDNVRVTLINKLTTMAESGKAVEEAFQANPSIFILANAIGDATLEYYLPVIRNREIISFAPFTGSTVIRGWDPYLYFVRADPLAELFALIRYALTFLRVRRLGFMYLEDVSFGDEEYEATKNVMTRFGYNLSGVFAVKSSLAHEAENSVFDAAWEAFANTRPQAVIVFGAPVKDTAKFVQRMLTDNRTAGAYLLAPSAVQDVAVETWRSAVKDDIKFVSGQVITTVTNPLADDTRYAAIRRFQDVMRSYMEKFLPESSGLRKNFPDNAIAGEMMVAGWIAGEILSQTLSSREWAKNRDAYLASLYNQRRYMVDNLVIGDYGGSCQGVAESEGAMCYCNQGGRTVYMKEFVDGHRADPLVDGTISFRTWECNPSEAVIVPPLNGFAIAMRDNPLAIFALRAFGVGAKAAVNNNSLIRRFAFTVNFVNSTVDGAAAALVSELKVKLVDVVAGVVTKGMLEVEDVAFIDPIYLQPRIGRFRKNVIRLLPTLEQQFFVIAEYLGKKSDGLAHAVIRSDDGATMAKVLRLSLETFGGSLLSTKQLAGGDVLVDHLPEEGDVLVVGISAEDVGAIAQHVVSHDGVRVFVIFLEFSMLYPEFVAAFRDGAGADRVVFATNLPHWNDDKTTSVTAQKFNAAVPDVNKRTPLAMMGFTTGLLLAVRSRMEKVSAEPFENFFFSNVAVRVDDMLYGPFIDGNACPVTQSGAGCGRNYGATQISVWPLARALDPAVPVLSPAVTPSMEYRMPVASGLTARQLTGTIVGSVVAALLLIALILLLLHFCRDSRDNANAPKERRDPVTLVFTDIESSTALWAACPEAMPDALATHHRLIRSLIAKYRCYEVKTIGDSFMIACKSAFAAVQLVRELQQVFLQHDWGTSVIDDAYHRFEEDRAEEDEEYVPPTARLDDAVYRQYWDGLRVRVGVHTGLCEIRHDEVTKGYDYYGATSNMAARTESVGNGGQVLLTRAAYFALSTAEREQVEVTALGGVALRGVPKPVEMYQLDAVPGRTFAALRLDRDVPDLDDGSDFESSEDASMYSARTGTAQAVVSVLTVTYGTLAAPQRLKALMPLCERWNVRLPRRPSLVQDEEYCRLVIARLAVKISNVMERKAQLGMDQNMSFTLSATAPGAHDTASGTWGRRGGEQVHARRFREAAPQSNSVEVHNFAADEPQFLTDDSVVTVRARRFR